MQATLIGLTAILMWSLLALLTVTTGRVPPFQLAAMTFAIGACVGPLTWIFRGEGFRALRRPTVRLSRALFPLAAQCTACGSRPCQLSLASPHCGVLRVSARRTVNAT